MPHTDHPLHAVSPDAAVIALPSVTANRSDEQLVQEVLDFAARSDAEVELDREYRREAAHRLLAATVYATPGGQRRELGSLAAFVADRDCPRSVLLARALLGRETPGDGAA